MTETTPITAPPRRRTRKKTTLFGPSFDKPDKRIYVYRENGDGGTDGSYLKRYDEQIELSDIERDCGPGIYIVMQAGTGSEKTIMRKRIVIHRDPEADDATTPATEAPPVNEDAFLARLERLVHVKALSAQLTGGDAPNMLQVIQAVTEMQRQSNPNNLEAYMAGQDATADAEPESDLNTALAGLINQNTQPAPVADPAAAPAAGIESQKMLGMFQKALKQITMRFAKMDERIAASESFAREIEPAVPTPGGKVNILETLNALLEANYTESAHILHMLKVIDKAAGGSLRRTIAETPEDALVKHLKEHLENAGKIECLAEYKTALQQFMGE